MRVPARIASIGESPAPTRRPNSRVSVGWGSKMLSVPRAILTPAARARAMARCMFGPTARALAANSPVSRPSPAMRTTASPAIRVETRTVPFWAMRRAPSSSSIEPCSIESTPASTAALIPSAPCAWAVILRSSMCAVATAARSSSAVYCWAPAVSPTDITPPVARF